MSDFLRDSEFYPGSKWLRIKNGKEFPIEVAAIFGRGWLSRFRVSSYEFKSLKSGALFNVSRDRVIELRENGELKPF